MNKKVMDNQLQNAVRKVALGYSLEEITEEYGVEEGELKLVRRKETHKEVPPDLKAMKLLLEGADYSALTEEELIAEKKRLLKEWKQNYDEEQRNQAGGGEKEEGAR